jgi:hypothetical protein
METRKSLGQLLPTTSTALYTVPSEASAVVSSIMVCNTGDAPAKYRVSHAVAGAAEATAQFLFHDAPLAPHASMAFTLGMTLAATDVVRVSSDTGLVAFNLWGAEIT